MKNFKLSKTWFYILSFTWGIPMTLIGALISLVLIILKHKPIKNGYGWYFEIGEDWGGVDFGMFSIVNRNPSQHILQHEFGHSIQNCIFGILFIPIIAIPSMIRYWYREYLVSVKHKDYSELPDYDSIWFEGQATMFGKRYIGNID